MKFTVSPSILCRYEENLRGGVVFIYNTERRSILLGNRIMHFICKEAEDSKEKDEIIDCLVRKYDLNANDVLNVLESAIAHGILVQEG